MVPANILASLVPLDGPQVEFELPSHLREISQENPARRIGWWAAFVRATLADGLRANERFSAAFNSSAFVGVGIIRRVDPAPPVPNGFPVINGYQFGVMFLTGRARSRDVNRGTLKLGKSGFEVPAVEYSADFTNHASSWSQGYTAALFEEGGRSFGITARHVVERYQPGQHVPVLCSQCKTKAKMERNAPGLIDAAIVTFPCGCTLRKPSATYPSVRFAVETETVDVHLGSSARRSATVMQGLSTPSQILSAATPRHFLVDEAGRFGDSGSLVSGETTGAGPWDLIGVYLGDCNCDDGTGLIARYGYGLDMDQAARIFGVGGLKGDYK